MDDSALNESASKSLTDEIRDTELQVLEHQRMVIVRADALIQRTRQQMIAPANLLLAGGIGFIVSELTKNKPCDSDSTSTPHEPLAAMTADLSRHFTTALSFLNTINSLYTTFRASLRKTQT